MAVAHTNRLAPQGNGAGVPAKQTVTNFIEQIRPEIAKALPPAVGKVLTAERLCRLALTACRLNPKLAECDFKSLAGALMTSAQLGLEPNTPLGHCYLIPRRNGKTGLHEATFQIGYQGMVELSQRSGRIQTQYAYPVYSNDEFDYWLGLDANIVHRPARGNRGPLVAVYAVAKYKDGGSNFVVLTIDEVENYRKRSMASNNGPWVTDYEAMACKTAFRRLFRWLPKSTELALAISADDSVPKWEAMTGEVVHDHSIVESSPPSQIAFQEEAVDAIVEVVEEPQPVEQPAQPEKKKTQTRRTVEAQAKVSEPPAAETDPPFDFGEMPEPAQLKRQPIQSRPVQPAQATVMQSQAQPSAKAQNAQRINAWVEAKRDDFEKRGYTDLTTCDQIIVELYSRLATEGVVSGTALPIFKKTIELGSISEDWETVLKSLDYAIEQIAKEMYGG